MIPNCPEHFFPAGTHSDGQYFHNTAGPAIVGSVDELRAIADAIPPNGRFLELGTWTGTGAAWIADQRPDVRIVSVDNLEFCPRNLLLWQCNQRASMRLFVGTTAEFFGLCRPASFDAILVDADHQRESVASDLAMAALAVVPGGVLLAHDYGDPTWSGVKEAVDEFCERTPWKIGTTVGSLVVMRS